MTDKNYTARQFDPWRTAPVDEVSRKNLVSAYYFDVDTLGLKQPGFEQYERTVIHHFGDTLATLAFTLDHQIALFEQYRVPLRRWTLEIPAGRARKGEVSHDGAIRELREESGLIAQDISVLLRFANSPGFSTQQTTIFLAKNCIYAPEQRDPQGPEEKRSTVRFVTLSDAYDMVLGGQIVDAKSIIAILTAHERRDFIFTD